MTVTAERAEHAELPTESLLEAFGRMTLIRVFDERVSELYRDSEVPGSSGPRPQWEQYAFYTERFP